MTSMRALRSADHASPIETTRKTYPPIAIATTQGKLRLMRIEPGIYPASHALGASANHPEEGGAQAFCVFSRIFWLSHGKLSLDP
jgi:hypothetical protein